MKFDQEQCRLSLRERALFRGAKGDNHRATIISENDSCHSGWMRLSSGVSVEASIA